MATSKQQSDSIMERRAVNSSGRLGSLYDGCRDHVIEKSTKTYPEQHFPPSDPLQCYFINGDSEESNNLLRYVGIQDELRLNILLHVAKRLGIAAVLDYPHHIDKYTRFLYYSWIVREHQLQKIPDFKEMTGIWHEHKSATHVITSIKVGIDVIVVLQLPSETHIANEIDLILKKICDLLLRDKKNILRLFSDKNRVLERIIGTKVYSNIPSLTVLGDIPHILQRIDEIKKNATLCYALSYTLQTITSLYPSHSIKRAVFRPLCANFKHDIEQTMLWLRNAMKRLDVPLKEQISKFSSKHIKQLLHGDQNQFQEVKEKYRKEMRQLSKLVVDARSNPRETSEIDQALSADDQIMLETDISELIRALTDSETDGRSITNSQQTELEHWNVKKRDLDKNKDRWSLDHVLTNSNRLYPILPPTDASKKNKPSCDVTNEGKLDSNLHLVNTDLLYNDSQIPNLMSLPSTKNSNDYNDSRSLPLINENDAVAPAPSSKVPTNEIVNILLLGETGVGKSTFINAFANYLTFNSLEQAQNSEPIVLIPVSFIMTTGDNFDEHTVKFGEFDNLNNENFNNTGQSVTQHCKSYVFDLHHVNGKTLRIIDTPGFGDTRGIDQDDRNMEHILQYINNLTHLNAICFLLKPNTSRLNMFFRTCLTQLFSFLNPDVRRNIIFCFTNARSTFYTPGDTAPLLRTMLNSLSLSGIQFEKQNTFCLDSESFRYLVALKSGIELIANDKHEYETSWTTSVKESNRLIKHIDTKLSAYVVKNGWQSVKHAQFEISHMIRQILEAMRNILRNMIICKKNLSNESIKLRSIPLHRLATRCRSCKSTPLQIAEFWVLPTIPHEIQGDCLICECASDQHVPVDYMLEYELSNTSPKLDQVQLQSALNQLSQACARFAHFLMHVACSAKDDPFSSGLKEMIVEEIYICEKQKLTDFNKQLIEELTKLQDVHRQETNKMKPNQESVNLPGIYKVIKIIGEYPLVHEQMLAVKQTQQLVMEDYEYEVQRI
jgi:GTPase SAR1 family protein